MTGLIFLAALALCLYIGWRIVTRLGNIIPNPNWRVAFKVMVFLALLASPFVDEVIGKQQFEALCKANGIESADVSKARDKRVNLEVGPERPLDGTVMPGTTRDFFYKDAESGEILIRHKGYSALGGWLMRYTPLSMGSPRPMLFVGGCPVNYLDQKSVFTKNNITLIN